jgi:FAD/FMN-containing dehydrogenase
VAKEVEKRLTRKALELGGAISGEHGIGKTKKEYLELMYPPFVIQTLRHIKTVLDPAWVLAPGNIL